MNEAAFTRRVAPEKGLVKVAPDAVMLDASILNLWDKMNIKLISGS
jgi:hypothetical protein